MRSVRTQLAYLASALVLLQGLVALVNPGVASDLTGLQIPLDAPRALSEIRAVYGAMFVVMGGVMLWAVPMRPASAAWLRFAGILWLAIAAGRLLSMLIDAAASPLNVTRFAIELLIGVAALLGGFQTPERRTAGRVRGEVEGDVPDPLRAYRS